MPFYVYIVKNRPKGTLYVGMTNDIARRVHEHRTKAVPGFSARYNLRHLVFYETYPTAYEAIGREKAMKKWNRAWKIELIEKMNPEWRDLYDDLNA